MKIALTELSTDGTVLSPDCSSFGQCDGCIYSKAITLKRITFTLYALFTLYAFSSQFSRIKVIINKQVVLQVK